jgi:VanZ family protein
MRPSRASDSGIFFDSTFWTAASALWTAAVLALALSPMGGSSWVMDTFGDKFAHAFAFVVGGVLWVKTIETISRLSRWGTMILGTVATLVVGVAIEILQSYIPSRQADMRDFEADVVGVLLALALIGLLKAIHNSKS